MLDLGTFAVGMSTTRKELGCAQPRIHGGQGGHSLSTPPMVNLAR